MKSGAPAYVLELDTAAVSFEGFVVVRITNTGQDETFASLILTPTLDTFGTPQEVGVDLPAGVTTETTLNAFSEKFGATSWLRILLGSVQPVVSATFWQDNTTKAAEYLPGDFAEFNPLTGTRLR